MRNRDNLPLQAAPVSTLEFTRAHLHRESLSFQILLAMTRTCIPQDSRTHKHDNAWHAVSIPDGEDTHKFRFLFPGPRTEQ